MPGEPYIAKWPGEFCNLKSREVVRPDCVGKHFSRSNIIDVINQLRQDELRLEQLWKTKDPWFRIDTTVVGVCVIDAYMAARYQAPSSANIDKMTVQDYAMHTVKDLWTLEISKKPRSEIAAAHQQPEHVFVSDGQLGQSSCGKTPLALEDAIASHDIRTTTRRDNSGDRVRRKCLMKADGCLGQCRTECTHVACMAAINLSNNRFGSTSGIFICANQACKLKHWEHMVKQSE